MEGRGGVLLESGDVVGRLFHFSVLKNVCAGGGCVLSHDQVWYGAIPQFILLFFSRWPGLTLTFFV